MKIRKLTAAFEEELLARRASQDKEALRVAGKIITDLRARGDKALFAWAKKLDGVDLTRTGLWIEREELESAQAKVRPEFLRAVEHAARNIRRVAEQQLPKDWTLEVEEGVRVSQRVEPLESVGCYVPGGRFALVSTLLMTAIPAQVAGVRRILAVCPKPNEEMLAAAALVGIEKVARIGGAQAIAALAYGTESIAAVDKICGPGNRFVTAAKQIVSLDCAIDLPAGPTEAVVLANEGNAAWIAADLLAQAEHAPDAGSFLVTTSARLAKNVEAEVMKQLRQLPKLNPAQSSARKSGCILLAKSLEKACEFVNRFAPEHLSVPSGEAEFLQRLNAAGTIFVGPLSGQPFGDYASGSNHVLPTGGWARRRGGLSAADFVKCITVQEISREGFVSLAGDVVELANAEGLLAHARAVEVRR